ncbi:MAG: DEAD/DEAH box helicase [Anaeromicrobium sp.]|jgi:non-specific serine/threonine protein kinase|uniref:DEAD/DEAH box helicase n=1 Tax=Anaeromicrobium sp. TaxID=1929132 RepID=UPI0025CEEFD4|nr:DEAD/DEAH box helicase [Anaeromicrobium sp.]MCT4595426.1 DEAD/DEAH box helicase [Anaeromicrobium sp.]
MEREKNQLIVIIKRDGRFEFDFQSITKKLNEEQISIQDNIISAFEEDENKGLFFLGALKKSVILSESVAYLKGIINIFIKNLSTNPNIEKSRENTIVNMDETQMKNLLNNAPYILGSEYLNDTWMKLFFERLNNSFRELILKHEGSVSNFFSSYYIDINLAGRVFFHLVESKKEEYPFAFLATYSIYNEEKASSKHLPLKNALIEYEDNKEKLISLLATVNKASKESSLISELISTGEIFHPIGLSINEAYTFLKEIPLYESSGILCRIPNWWKNKNKSLKMSVNMGESVKSRVNSEALIDFNPQIFLGEDEITKEDIRKLISETEGLAFIKGKWIEVDHDRLKEMLKAYEKAQELTKGEDINIIEALKFKLNAEKILDIKDSEGELEVTNGQWLNSVFDRLSNPNKIQPITCGDNFNATLRSYQNTGISWLNYMKNLGLGACLADDMGLGKTIQVIALLNHIKANKKEKTILVVPASLISNWVSEIKKFAPLLKYYVIHPSENKDLDKIDMTYTKSYDLFITTYAMVSKYEWVKEVLWDTVILDEAQAIKNPRTKQTKTVKELKAKHRIAMTGTPIENRLSDLWSLFDFLNKGLLGSTKEFNDFIKALKQKQKGYSRLKKVVNPFILRRVKTDKNVISDLPDKIEMKTYANLTKKQVVLYGKLVKDIKEKLESADEGIQRKGIVLSSLMKFKQICNHPSQYLGQESYGENESGKYARLREICETIYEKRERVLVFTQFREMVKPISDFLEEIFNHKGVSLHGGTAVKKRKEIVDIFQGEEYVPFMVLSIKAGGVGLNLTAANHVIHFDRWWNPAVENQATDRAFRIGQQKNVIVHKFITKGTIEEKIDMMIEDKIKLSKEIVSDSQENWITNMNNDEILDLFKLKI